MNRSSGYNKKGKKKNTVLRRNIDDDDEEDENNVENEDGNEIPYSNVIMVNSSENMKDNDNTTTKRKNSKKKVVKTKYDVEESENDDFDQKEDVDRRTPQEKANDSRAELFRARSTDELRTVSPQQEMNITSGKKGKKKKLKVKTKKKKQSTDQIENNDHEDDDIEDGETERNIKKKKKKKKNKTDSNDGDQFTDSSSNDAFYNGAGMRSSTFNGKLPPIKENGHASKLQPIDLRGRKSVVINLFLKFDKHPQNTLKTLLYIGINCVCEIIYHTLIKSTYQQ